MWRAQAGCAADNGLITNFYHEFHVLAVSIAGCAVVTISVLAHMLPGMSGPVSGQPSWVNYAEVVSLMSIRVGYILFGVDALRYRLLPRGNVLPLLVGLTGVFSLAFDWFGVPAIIPEPLVTPFLHFTISGACWVLLGMALMDPGREPQLTAVL